MELAEGKTKASDSFKGNKPSMGRRNGRSVVSLLGSLKRHCTIRETSRPSGCLGTMLAKLTTPQGDGQKVVGRSGRERRKKSKVDVHYSKLSVEDRLYLKSQLAIWFPFIVHRPTLSELEKALAEMGARILRNVAAFQIMDLNSTLTESKEQRRLYRKCHQSLTPRDVKILQSPSTLKKGVERCVEVGCNSEGKPSHSPFALAKLRHFHRTESSNSFINAEKNWRHNLMSEHVVMCSELPMKEEKHDVDTNHLRLLQLYDRQNYNVPAWFYWLLELGSIIDLELLSMNELSEGTPEEVTKLAWPPRRISLHLVPTGSSSFVKGHLFVSVIEQERVLPAGDDCTNKSTNNKMSNMTESFDRTKLSLPKNFSDQALSSKRYGNEPSETVDEEGNDFSEDSSSQDHFFPKERNLSFQHNWSNMLPKPGHKLDETRWGRKIQKRSRSCGTRTIRARECSNDGESNHSASPEHLGYEAVQQNSEGKTTDSISTRTETSDGSSVYKDARGRRRLYEKIRKLLSVCETRTNLKTSRTSAGGICKNDGGAKIISNIETRVNKPRHNVTARCELKEQSSPSPSSVQPPESPQTTSKMNVNTEKKNVQNSKCKQRHLSGVSSINTNVTSLSACGRNIEVIAHTYLNDQTVSRGCRLQDCDKSLPKRRSKRRKGAVRFGRRELVRPLDKSNSSLNESGAHFVSDYLLDDLLSARSTDGHCGQNRSNNSNTEYEDERRWPLPKRGFQIPPAYYNKTKRNNNNYSLASIMRNGNGASKKSKAKDYSDALANCQRPWARQNANYRLFKTKMENSYARSFSDSLFSGTISNEATRGSVTNFVREQWRSCNIDSTSSSSNDKSDFQSSYYNGQSSCAESESSSVTARANIKQVRYQNAPKHMYNVADVGYHSTPRPAGKRSLWSSERQRKEISSKLSTSVKRSHPEGYNVNGDVMTRMYQDFKKNVEIRLKSSGPLNESRRGRATVVQSDNAESEFNKNNDNLLTRVASTSTSSKFTTASTTNKTRGHGTRSPAGRNQSTSQYWMTLRDLSSLLAYCSKILSKNEPLTEGTIEILKAVDETLSWYFIEDETGHLPRDKSHYEVKGVLYGPRNLQCEKEMPKLAPGLKHQDCRNVNSSRRKTKSNKARLTKWPDCVNLSSLMTDERPNYPAPPSVSSHHLDETQNKLDSDHDDLQTTKAQVGSDTENHMRQELDEPGSWQLHRRNSEGADRSQQGTRHEMPPPPHTYLNDSITAVLSPYDDWPKQVYQSKAPEQYASMPAPPDAERPAENATQKRQYFEQKIGPRTNNDPTYVKRRCAQNTMYETDTTGCSPIADCQETGRAVRQKRFPDSNCQRFSLNLTNSHKPCVNHQSMCCNKTASCSENPCAWNNSSPMTPCHCLGCLNRMSCCVGMRKGCYGKPQFTVSRACHRRGLSDFPSRLQPHTVPRIPSIQRRFFDFPGPKCCLPAASARRPCRQTVGDMTSEFEKRFGSPEESVPMRKVSISESMFTDELTESVCGLDNSPALIRYADLVPNLKKMRACVNQSAVDHSSQCYKESLQSETVECIKELLRACIARERHEDNAFNHCYNSEARIKTCKLSDDDRQLFEALKCKLDSKLIQSLLKPNECCGSIPKSNQTTQCDARIVTPSDCPCHQTNPAVTQDKTERPCCMCCPQESKTACKPATTRMHSKGLQADMSWSPGKSSETSSQTCKCLEDRRFRCACCLPLDNGTCSAKPARVCECVGLDAEESPCENERVVRAGCLAAPKDKRPRCAVIGDISSCTHQCGASGKKIDKRNKSLQTTRVCRLSPPCVRCGRCPREERSSVCMSHSEIGLYPKLSPERVSMLASSRGCRERDQCWVHKNFKSDLEKSRPTCGSRNLDRNSFYVKKWECPLESSSLTSYLTDCIEKSRKTYNTRDCSAFVPTSRNRPPCVFNGNIEKCKRNEKYPLKPAWPDCGESKQKDCYKKQQINEHCAKDSPDVDRPIVHIRYKSKKASGKSEITVDSIPCNEDQIASPVRNLALELKKHVQKIIQNSKELKQQALNADKCPKAGGNMPPESDAKIPGNGGPPEVVRFHSSRKDDGSWSYVMKIKSPVARKPEEMSESYASKNVNCGNNNFGDPDPKEKSFYGVKINVTLPETYVNDETDRLINEVLPEILKIVLCVILKVNINGVQEQRAGDAQSSREEHIGLQENVNSNACSDDAERDTRDCCNLQKLKGDDRFPRPTPVEGFKITAPRRLPGREKNKMPLQASQEIYTHTDNSSFDKSEPYARSIRPCSNGGNINKAGIYCSPHRRTASSIGRTNRSPQSGKLCGSIRGRQFYKTFYAQTEFSLGSQCGHQARHDNLKEIPPKDEEKNVGGCQKCYGQREVLNKGRTVIIEDFSSLEQSSSKSIQSNAHDLCRCNCTKKTNNLCKGQNLRFNKQVRTSEKGVQSMGGARTTDGRTSAHSLVYGRESHSKNICDSHYAPHEIGVVCSHPYVVMECYDSTPEFTTDTPTESRHGLTSGPALPNRHEVGGGQTYLARAEYTGSSRPLPVSKKMGDGEAPSKPASQCSSAPLDEGPPASRRGPLSSKKLQFARSSAKVKRFTSDDSADSCHGIEDLPVDSGVSAMLIQNITDTGPFTDAAAAKVDANRGKRSINDANPSAKTSQWNISESGTQISCRSKHSCSGHIVGENDTGERSPELCATTINKALIDWWNCPKQIDDKKNNHSTHTLVRDPELSLPTYRRSEGCKLPLIMSDRKIVSTVLGGEVCKNKFRGWVKCKDSATLTDNLVTFDKSMGVRDTKIRKPICAILNSPTSKVQNDIPVELNEATKLVPEVKKFSSEVKTHLRPDSLGTTTQDDQPWQNVFVGSAELTEATSHRVVLEGAFYKSRHPGDGPVGQMEMCSSFLPQSSTFLLPFRLVLLTSGDGAKTDTVSGTYLRRMVSTDRFLKWNINFGMPQGRPLHDIDH